MSSACLGWDDFEDPASVQEDKPPPVRSVAEDTTDSNTKEDCNWGFNGPDRESCQAQLDSENSKFINFYEQYLSDKQSLDRKTKNHHFYANNPSKALREWFENEGHEYSHKLEQTRDSQYKCSIDVPVGDQDFTFDSEPHHKKQSAIDEVCLAACKLLDDSDLLRSWPQDNGVKDLDRKRRIDEANKEDDIELDNTKCTSSQEPKSKRTTQESLKSKWTELNMTILSLKAKLVKLDLSVSKQKKGSKDNEESSDEEDPLDAFMSNLDKKTGLTLDEKIEKSRLKSKIADLEREQEEISEMINETNT